MCCNWLINYGWCQAGAREQSWKTWRVISLSLIKIGAVLSSEFDAVEILPGDDTIFHVPTTLALALIAYTCTCVDVCATGVDGL